MGREILVENTRDPLFGMERGEFMSRVASRLRGSVGEAYFFGSFAADRTGPDSDIDLLLVKETAALFVERVREFADLLDLNPAMDILVYPPAEFRRLTGDPSSGFWTEVTASMVRFL